MTAPGPNPGLTAPEPAESPDVVLDALAAERVRSKRLSSHGRRRILVRRAKRGGLVLAVMVGVGILQLLWASWNMHTAAEHVAQAKQSLTAGDIDASRAWADKAHTNASRAGWGTFGPHLWAAQLLPFAGDDVRAVRTVVAVSKEATGPLADKFFDLRNTLDPEAIRPVNGQTDLDRFVAGGKQMHDVSLRMAELDGRVAELEPGSIAGPLREGVARLAEEVHKVRTLVEYGDGVLQIVPAALGSEGPRRYLVAFQNNAELRSTGGIPGAFAVLEADKGMLTMRDQGAVKDLGGRYDDNVLALTDEEQLLFDGKLGRFVQNVNLTPDWQRSGQLLTEMWRTQTGEHLDGVFSVDPVALSYVLRGSGPIALRDDKVARSDNAVQLLLNQTYFDYPGQIEQDDFFEDSARRIFKALIRGVGNAGTALDGLYEGLREGRAYVYLTSPEEQARVAGGSIAGGLQPSSPTRPEVGVFLNDATATKLDYYVTSTTNLVRDRCVTGGGQRLLVTTTLVSKVPADAASLPRWLVGFNPTGVKGELLTTVMAYGPRGSRITDPTIDGRTGAPSRYTHDGHPVVARTVLLRPGQSMTLTWVVHTSSKQNGAPVLRTTPGAHSSGVGVVEPRPCVPGA